MLLRILLLALLPASALADAGGEVAGCPEEPGLSRAAAELLFSGEAPSADALARAVREAGSDAVGVRAYFARDPDASAVRWIATFQQSADAPLVCGVARSERGQLWLAAPRAGSLDHIAPQHAVVRGSLVSDFRDPEIVVEDARGSLQRFDVDRDQLARGIPVSDELVRPARVQLLARGPAGPRPIAERVLPSRDRNAPAQVQDTAHDEGLPLVQRLALVRQEHGLSALRDNRLLTAVAAAHAGEVCERGRVAHELEPGEDPERRLRSAGVRARRVGETVARAASPAAAFRAFERSPSHRLTLLEPGFTDAGIGEVVDARGRSCVVVLLAAWPRYVGR